MQAAAPGAMFLVSTIRLASFLFAGECKVCNYHSAVAMKAFAIPDGNLNPIREKPGSTVFIVQCKALQPPTPK